MTLPTVASSAFSGLGDVLTVDQPAAQQMLASIFGSSLQTPTNPPPNVNGVPTLPPPVTTTTAPSTASTSAGGAAATTTPTTAAPPPSFDPVPCTPS